jgi:EAL domain-containing protein (putative c-di-GMP-specific phosphodiesterase class I)
LVAKTLAATDLDPACVILEVTESMVMRDPEQARTIMAALKQLGVGISIDDFGTGHSSLSYLKRFCVDELKIDKSFIDDIPADADATAIVNAVLAMAHTLGLKVVAEGVETRSQLAAVTRGGCDQVQGYLFSKPLPPEAFATLMQRQAAKVDAAA